jgi:hypothetical protein
MVTVVDVPERVDLRVLAGRPFSALLSIVTGSASTPVPVEAGDIASVRAHVRAGIDSELVVHVFTTDDGSAAVVGTGSDAASVRLSATSDETTEWQALWPGTAPETVVWWDLEIADTGGERHQVTSPGTITLVHQVTR